MIEGKKDNKYLIGFCVGVTFIWGMIAHAYMFLNNAFSHDSLNEFNTEVFGNILRLQRGRVLVPAYRIVTRSVLTLPWLIGLLSLLWISAAVYFVVKIFQIQSKLTIGFIAGIMTANLAVTATAATYIHDLDCNMFALMLSVIAVYLWQRYKKGFLFGAVLVGFSLGFYQSFIAVTITLGIIALVMDLLEGECFLKTIVKGLKCVAMLIGGGLVYLVTIKVVGKVTGVALVSGGYNSIDTALGLSVMDLVKLAFEAYEKSIHSIIHMISVYSPDFIKGLHYCMIGLGGVFILFVLVGKKIGILEKVLLAVLLLIMPFGLDVTYILTNGTSHDLMHYAFCLVYILLILVARWVIKNFRDNKYFKPGIVKVVVSVLVFIMLWGNIQTSNTIYLRKNQQQDATLSLFTRIMYKMEDYEGYIPGETPVVFVGKPDRLINRIPGFEFTNDITGGIYITTLGSATRSFYNAYFRYVLLTPIKLADQGVWNTINADEAVKEMPMYPNDGCMEMIEGVLVVKLS